MQMYVQTSSQKPLEFGVELITQFFLAPHNTNRYSNTVKMTTAHKVCSFNTGVCL